MGRSEEVTRLAETSDTVSSRSGLFGLELSEEVTHGPPPELSIVVPCLDEEDNVGLLLKDLDDLRIKYNLDNFETLVLDDSSTDRTFERAVECVKNFPELRIRVLRRYEPRRGYGAIVRFGIAHARGLYCVPVSADGVDPIEVIPIFLKKMRAGADLVQCSRYLKEGHADTIPFKYKFYQAIWRFLLRLLSKEDIRDSTYAFKIFRRTDVLALGLSSNSFSISPEIFLKLLLSGARIEYVARGQSVRRHGKSKFNFWHEGPRFAWVLFRAWLHRLGILWF